VKTKSALSYFGSDSAVAAELAAKLDHCDHVTIPFCGGMSILPHLKALAIVANDLNSAAINFYQTMALHTEPLIRRCKRTLSHPDELELAITLLSASWATQVDKAWAYWALCWIPRKGAGGTNVAPKMPSVRWKADGGTNATRIASAAEDLNEWADHFRRCEWVCMDYRALLPKCADDAKCGIYVDAPWIGAGDQYLYRFEGADHIALRMELDRFEKTSTVVRYGDHPMIRDLYKDWKIVEASARTQANKQLPELWITNF